MAKTEMLYMEDNYIRSFTAKVIAVGENYVVLDRTAFYPEGGGQEGVPALRHRSGAAGPDGPGGGRRGLDGEEPWPVSTRSWSWR